MKSLNHIIEDCQIDGTVIIITPQDWNDFTEYHIQSMKEHARSQYFLGKYNSLNEWQKQSCVLFALREMCVGMKGQFARQTNRVLIMNVNTKDCISYQITERHPFL
jgi:hypothetical protein